MTTTPFEQDNARKANGLRDYHDRRLRAQTCAECGILRPYHRETGCRFRRMTNREWADWCGAEAPKEEEKYLRAIVEIEDPQSVAGLHNFILECGHREYRFLDRYTPKIPTVVRCATCAKERKMGWLNGKDAGRASVSAPALPIAIDEAVPTAPTSPASYKGNGTTTEVARFLPVMDLEQAKARRDAIVALMQSVMKEGVDYGKIPGNDKPMLFQPGAQKLCSHFGLTFRYRFLEKEEDWGGERHGGEPFFYYQIGADVYRGEFLLAEGIGSCTSWESKYRWRTADRTCPSCGQPFIRKSKRDPEWYCWAKLGGCGATFPLDDVTITGQQLGRKPNPDIFDQVNTVLKMAYKRCLIHGTINGTSASEFFSQDMEDFSINEEPIDTGGYREGTSQAAQYVAQQKIARVQPLVRPAPWKSMAEVARSFEQVRERVGEVAYRDVMERYGWRNFQEMRNALDSRDKASKEQAKLKAAEAYFTMDALAQKEGK